MLLKNDSYNFAVNLNKNINDEQYKTIYKEVTMRLMKKLRVIIRL